MSFLAAKVGSDGSCRPVHSVLAGTSRPLGSMFKLFVLGALANAVHEHRVSWTQKVAVTAAIKVGGSGTLQNSPDGTELTVEQVAVKMISISDNTAADMLLSLVGRGAVEDQVRAWSSHASIDIPFLTVKELFSLKYHDFPALADHYLSLTLVAAGLVPRHDGRQGARQRGAVSQPAPRHQLDRVVRLGGRFVPRPQRTGKAAGSARTEPFGHGAVDQQRRDRPQCEHLAQDLVQGRLRAGRADSRLPGPGQSGQTFVVVVLTEDTSKPVQESAAVEIQALNAIAGAFGLMG